jgi:hypothetical protein
MAPTPESTADVGGGVFSHLPGVLNPLARAATGAGETGLAAITSMAAPFVGIARGEKGAEGGTSGYQPKTKYGQQYTQGLGELLHEIAKKVDIPGLGQALGGLGGELGTLGRAASIDVGTVANEGGIMGARASEYAQKALNSAGVGGTKLEKVAPASKAQAAAIKGQEAGFVLPPSQAKPSLLNKLITGYGGKIQTEQAASAKNQPITNRIIKDDLGIPQDRDLDEIEFSQYRKAQSKPYDEVRALPDMYLPTNRGAPSELKVKTSIDPLSPGREIHSVSGDELVRAWKKANADARGYYKSDKINPHPDTLAKAHQKDAEAHAIDDMISMHAQNSGKTDLHARLQTARKNIAKSHDIEAATNPSTGNVDAQALYNNLRKGKYMTGGQKEVANFAGNFKKSVQLPEKIGAQPGISPLDVATAGIEGTGAMAAGKPGLAASAISAALGRPIARKIALSDWYQKKMAAAQQYQKVKK